MKISLTEAQKKEFKRQSLHLLLGLILGLGIGYSIINDFVLLALLIISILAAWLLSEGYKIPLYEKFLSSTERLGEKNGLRGGGFIAFLVGSLLVSLFFSDKIAGASIIILGIADSLSSIISIRFGRIKHPFSTKNLEGPFFGALIAAVIASLYIPFWVALMAGLIAMFFEGIEYFYKFQFIDDNIVVPVVAAIVILLLL